MPLRSPRARQAGTRSSFSTHTLTLLLLSFALLLTVPVTHAAEPMPEIMKTLLRIFPERDGRFVEEPLGSAPGTPEKARPFFKTFRVVVPGIDAVEPTIGRLLAAAGELPIRKISRYDRKPNAPGLPGFRGVWCRTEDKSQVGFSILTENQNRFLIWAKYQYYPAFGNDGIPGKVRDWYARSVGQYLASLDAGVPGTEPPVAISRTLPEWMDLYAPVRGTPDSSGVAHSGVMVNASALRRRYTEIKAWGLSGVLAFQPTPEAITRYIESASDTLWPNREIGLIQHLFRNRADGVLALGPIRALSSAETLRREPRRYLFAIDRYGRVRCSELIDTTVATSRTVRQVVGPMTRLGQHALLFPGSPFLTGGTFRGGHTGEETAIEWVAADAGAYFYSWIPGGTQPGEVAALSDTYVETLGHFFAALSDLGIPSDRLMIRKFSP